VASRWDAMRSGRLTILLLAAAGTVLPAASAHAATAISANWSGYVVTPKKSVTKFKRVSGTWVVPQGACAVGRRGYSATWVGLGGRAHRSKALEQTGTEFDCAVDGTPRYYAWYELLPAAQRVIKMPVHPGDKIDAAVTVKGHRVRIYLRNRTRGRTFKRTLRMKAPDTTSAEWIVEAPSRCHRSGRCAQLALSNFGTIPFARALVTTARGTRGSVSNRHWAHTQLTLNEDARRGSAGLGSGLGAQPSALSVDGKSFSVAFTQRTT
jgi:Peptidase A4 family